jgi:hypothetical protein
MNAGAANRLLVDACAAANAVPISLAESHAGVAIGRSKMASPATAGPTRAHIVLMTISLACMWCVFGFNLAMLALNPPTTLHVFLSACFGFSALLITLATLVQVLKGR